MMLWLACTFALLAHAADTGPVLRAVIQSSTVTTQKVGAYEFSADSYGFTLIKQNGELNSAGGAGVIENGAFMAVAVDDWSNWGMGKMCTAYIFNTSSFEKILSAGMDVGENTISTTLALSPTGKGAYGCFEDTNGGYEFGLFDSDNLVRSTIATLSTPWLACDFTADGTLYAIDRNGKLSSVNIQTGEMTQIAETGITATELGSGTIDKVTSIFYVANGKKLYSIQLPTGNVKELYALEGNEQLVGMFVQKNGTVTETDKPDKVTDLIAEFEEYSLTGKVRFTMPETSTTGNALEGTLGYKISEGTNVLATGSAAPKEEVSVNITFDNIGKHNISVVVTSGEAQSEETTIGIEIAEKPEGIIPPYFQPFNTQDDFNTLTTIDGNKDKWGWMWWQEKAYCQPCFTNSSDDYLITPALWLEAGKRYPVSFTAWQRDIAYVENLEVVVGDKPEAGSLQAIGSYEFTDGKPHDLEFSYTAERTGLHYIGLHLVSAKNMYGIYMDNLKVGKGALLTAPAEQPFTATADAKGALSATITITPNAKSIDGNSTELTKIKIFRNDKEVKVFTEGLTSELSFTDNVEENGLYTYSVIAENADGEGAISNTKLYVGINKAGPVQSASAVETENIGEVTVSWEAPNTDIDGNPINPELISYMIMYKISGQGQKVAGRNIKGTSHTFRIKEESDKQDFVTFLVFTETQAGVNDLGNVATDAIPVGKPDEMPYHLGFGGTDDPIYNTTSERTTAKWTESSDVEDHDGDGVYLFNETYDGIGGAVYTGKINVSKDNPVFTFWYMCMADGKEAINIEVNDGTGFKPLSTANINEGKDMQWSKHSVSLSGYKGKNVQIRISYVSQGYRLALDDFTLTEASSLDLSPVGIGVPVSVKAGVKFNVRVEVANLGAMPSGAFDVELYRDNKLIETMSADNLDGVSSKIFEFEQSVSSLVNSYSYKAKVVSEYDQNKSNNETSEISIEREATTLPVPTKATAMVDTDSKKVEIAWEAPQFDFTPVTTVDGAEDYRPFSTGLPTSQLSSYDNIGEWKTIDGDGLKTIVIQQGDTYLMYPNANTPLGFIVFNPSEAGIPDQYFYKFEPRNPDTNSRYFAAITSSVLPNDDWLISPMLSGNAQEISFFAKSCVDQYPESFEVYYSNGGTEVKDFVKAGSESNIPAKWTEYKYRLPEGARHFAIHYMANDRYMFMVDDFTFEKAARDEKITLDGYNVYRQNDLISSIEKDAKLSYTDMENDNPENTTYSLTAVYAEGESEPVQAKAITTSVNGVSSDSMQISVSGRKIIVENPAAEAITICDTAGRNIVNGNRGHVVSVDVIPGVYIVKDGTTTIKIMVK